VRPGEAREGQVKPGRPVEARRDWNQVRVAKGKPRETRIGQGRPSEVRGGQGRPVRPGGVNS